MTVTLVSVDPCAMCGYLRRAYQFPTVRINKRSLRTVGAYLAAAPQACPECGWDGPAAQPKRWRLEPGDAALVAAYRARHWPQAVA